MDKQRAALSKPMDFILKLSHKWLLEETVIIKYSLIRWTCKRIWLCQGHFEKWSVNNSKTSKSCNKRCKSSQCTSSNNRQYIQFKLISIQWIVVNPGIKGQDFQIRRLKSIYKRINHNLSQQLGLNQQVMPIINNLWT